MDGIQLIREQLAQTREFINETLADVTPEQAHWQPPGIANPIGATYAHAVLGEDGFVNAIVRGGAPLFATSWAGRTGVSEPPPEDFDWSGWGRGVRVELDALRRYAEAVAAETDAWIAALQPADLDRTFDFQDVGLATPTLGWVLGSAVAGHLQAHWGEICCLKGLQGGKGYRF